MRHAAGPGAADDLGFFSQRDRPGSCPLLITYYRLVGSPLNERESPHRIWSCALVLVFLPPWWMRSLPIWCPNSSGAFPPHHLFLVFWDYSRRYAVFICNYPGCIFTYRLVLSLKFAHFKELFPVKASIMAVNEKWDGDIGLKEGSEVNTQ